MKIEQRHWTKSSGWNTAKSTLAADADLVFIFGETGLMKEENILQEIRSIYNKAQFIGCSTAGEIQGPHVLDDSICLTAIQFKSTKVKSASLHLGDTRDGFEAGQRLAQSLDPKGLTHVLLFSVGLNINGSELVRGMTAGLPSHVTMTGGLAGDKDRFQETLVLCNDELSNHMIAAVGLYGQNLKVGTASLGGWDSFGTERLVTKSKANVLYELDNKSALELYKTYLGEHANDLPGSALLFPLAIKTREGENLVRTILGVNEADQSLTFAGDVPEGSLAHLMKANFDRLIGGAIGAAEKSSTNLNNARPELAILISCVGRKLVLKQRIEEEVEGVQEIFGAGTALTGFYSYGEISPFTPNAKCELHNQTMTITTLVEVDENAA
jgi:hypothetical protein